ncbi:MAG: hypothetical protein ACRD2I_22250 [Vicinamibacterales bacterium]
MRLVKALCCAAALTALIAPGAHADEWNKKTILTFSGPVQIPGTTLPAGSYVFKLADIPGSRHVVQVFDKDEMKLYTTILALPNQRAEPSDKPIVLFSERASGTPQAVKVWYYPGDTIGNEFVYPKSQAVRIAKATHTRVLAVNDEPKMANTAGEIPVEMKTAAVGSFDENGNWESEANRPVVTSTAPAASAKAAPAATMARARTTAGTSGSSPVRQHLPRTASSLALFELISGLSFAGSFAVRQIRRRVA